MKENSLFWQWVGYLSNPIRSTDIHAEMHVDKEHEFREVYLKLSGEPISYPGKSRPFYVWKEDANKYGKQLRVYFKGQHKAFPEKNNLFNVTPGRSAGVLRINSNKFVSALFSVGFLLGENTNPSQEIIKSKVPSKFMSDFQRGFNMVSPVEEMETLVIDHCIRNRSLIVQNRELQKLWKRKDVTSSALLDELCQNKTLLKNIDHNSCTLSNIEKLRGVIESKPLRIAVEQESDNNKREILMETYVRDRGWIRIAKATFGDMCMLDGCQNTFRKENRERYIETHHIKSLSEGGHDHIQNLVMLCAHHHRMAHFSDSQNRQELHHQFLQKNTERLAELDIL